MLGSWLRGGVAVALPLLAAVWAVASAAAPDPTPIYIPGLSAEAHAGHVVDVLYRK